MEVSETKCVAGYPVKPGDHHSQLHAHIFALEKENKELKAEVAKMRSGK